MVFGIVENDEGEIDFPLARDWFNKPLQKVCAVEGKNALTRYRVLERDPSSATVLLQIALSFWNQRRYDDMITWANRSLELDPHHLLAREYLAGAYLKKGDLDRHMAVSLTHARAAGCPVELLDDLRRAYEACGRTGVVEFALRVKANGPPVQLALLHGEAGHLDEAFRRLDAAIALRDPALVHLAVAPQWDCLREDGRFGWDSPPRLIVRSASCSWQGRTAT